MIRLHAVVEGQTEETFVRDVLAPELGARNVFVVSHCVTTGRRRARVHRGGVIGYQQLKRDLSLWMKQDGQLDAWFTTMIDYYALPDDFPGYYECAKRRSPVERVECLEDRLAQDIAHRQFIPYIQLHEFEALLFADPRRFEIEFPGNASAVEQLIAIRDQFRDPEDIDDRPEFAPSKRILKVLPGYRKPVAGPTIAKHIGLATLRHQCAHFNRWIEKVEAAVR